MCFWNTSDLYLKLNLGSFWFQVDSRAKGKLEPEQVQPHVHRLDLKRTTIHRLKNDNEFQKFQ
jgi:hypothetical protein